MRKHDLCKETRLSSWIKKKQGLSRNCNIVEVQLCEENCLPVGTKWHNSYSLHIIRVSWIELMCVFTISWINYAFPWTTKESLKSGTFVIQDGVYSGHKIPRTYSGTVPVFWDVVILILPVYVVNAHAVKLNLCTSKHALLCRHSQTATFYSLGKKEMSVVLGHLFSSITSS